MAKPRFERKIIPMSQAKATDSGTGTFEGYGSTFGHVDSYGDRIMPGAYKDTLPDFLKRGASLLSHDWKSLPIGTVKEAREDNIGLWIVSEYHSTAAAQDARTVAKERLDRGATVGLSIGYAAKEWKYVREEDADWPIRELSAIDLFEISQVLVPADSYAGVSGVKTGVPFLDDAEQVIEAAESLLQRAKGIQSLRAKDGRAMAQTSRERISEVATKLRELTEELTAFGSDMPAHDSEGLRKKVAALKMRNLRVQHLLRSS